VYGRMCAVCDVNGYCCDAFVMSYTYYCYMQVAWVVRGSM